jgi:uncharacterized protein (DUF427 family)
MPYPQPAVGVDHVEPVPRRVRATLGERTVLDTIGAQYLWEWPFYPQFQIPMEDIDPAVLVDEGHRHRVKRGTVERHGLRVGEQHRPGAVRHYVASHLPAIVGTARIDWEALDAWYEEDELLAVHPRNPYVRVDALRSTRAVRIELDGVLLAESTAPVVVFETGLPTRYYLDRSAVDLTHLRHSDTVTSCPYNGRTSADWSAEIDGIVRPDVAWSYDHPTPELLPVAGLVAFYDEQVDVTVDGVRQARPVTHFTP